MKKRGLTILGFLASSGLSGRMLAFSPGGRAQPNAFAQRRPARPGLHSRCIRVVRRMLFIKNQTLTFAGNCGGAYMAAVLV